MIPKITLRRARLKQLLTATMLVLVCSCQSVEEATAQPENSTSESQTNESTLAAINKSLAALTNNLSQQSYQLSNQVQTLAEDELKKLIKFEYRVIDLPANKPASEIESTLIALGEERWNCFHIESLTNHTRIFCRRLPFSVLRAVPYLW